MLKIGEFSKLSHLTVKTLRFYEKEGLLIPATVDGWTGYRLYETYQLEDAAKIKSYRQLDLSIDEIKKILSGKDAKEIFREKADALNIQKKEIDVRLSVIKHILEDDVMKYQVTVKEIPEAIVYYSEVKLPGYSDMMKCIPAIGAECAALNPHLKCAEPTYSFCEYLDEEHKEKDVFLRYNEAVNNFGNESEKIKFRKIPSTKVLSIFHKGAYDQIGEAYAFIMKYAEENGYKVTGLSRESYIDGIWNKDSVDQWLTEIQLPIE
ncbi:MAG: MerR family transcriptional regulator [Acutalibacteraceae bacterium]